jgi:hypothetical protein
VAKGLLDLRDCVAKGLLDLRDCVANTYTSHALQRAHGSCSTTNRQDLLGLRCGGLLGLRCEGLLGLRCGGLLGLRYEDHMGYRRKKDRCEKWHLSRGSS